MELRSCDLVVFDYELELPRASVIELELYSRGIARSSTVLLGDQVPLGTQRRAGILDVPIDRYEHYVAAIERQVFDTDWARLLRASLTRIVGGVETTLGVLERDLAMRAPALKPWLHASTICST